MLAGSLSSSTGNAACRESIYIYKILITYLQATARTTHIDTWIPLPYARSGPQKIQFTDAVSVACTVCTVLARYTVQKLLRTNERAEGGGYNRAVERETHATG